MACDGNFPDVKTLTNETLAAAIILADQLASEVELDERLQLRRQELKDEFHARRTRLCGERRLA